MSTGSQGVNAKSTTTDKTAGLNKDDRRSVWLFYIGTFFYWMAMYLYVPVLPVYAQSLGASLTTVGIIVAAYALPQFLFRIPLGIWADALGRQKPLIIGGGIILVAGSIGLGLSPNPLFLGLFRTLVGIGAAMWVVFPIYLVTFYTGEKMEQSVGVLNFVTGAALVAATMLGGLISDYFSEKTAFYSAAGLAVACIVCILITRERRTMNTGTRSWQDFGQVARKPLLAVVSIMGLLMFLADFASVWGFVPVYAAGIGATDTQLGILAMMVTAGTMVGSLIIAGAIKRLGQVPPIVIAAVFLGFSLLAVPFLKDVFPLGAALAIHGIGYGMLATQLMVLSIYNIAPRQRATAMGFYQAIYAIGMLSGPLIAGLLSDHYGLAVVFYLGGALCLAVIGLAFLPVLPGKARPAADKSQTE
jgi:predicted MFS family arabinose efflux permease